MFPLVYYSTRLLNLFPYQISISQNAIHVDLIKFEYVLKIILSFLIFLYMIYASSVCALRPVDFLIRVMHTLYPIVTLVLYLNCLSLKNKLKLVFKSLFYLQQKINLENETKKDYIFFLSYKILIFLMYLIQDLLELRKNKYNLAYKCYIIGYLRYLPFAVFEITYIFVLIKLRFIAHHLRTNLKNWNLNTNLFLLKKVKNCRHLLNSYAQIPILINLGFHFTASLTEFDYVVGESFRHSFSELTIDNYTNFVWGLEILCEIYYFLFIINQYDIEVGEKNQFNCILNRTFQFSRFEGSVEKLLDKNTSINYKQVQLFYLETELNDYKFVACNVLSINWSLGFSVIISRDWILEFSCRYISIENDRNKPKRSKPWNNDIFCRFWRPSVTIGLL